MNLRDYFAENAPENEIRNWMLGELRSNGYIHARSIIRTREEARYAYADAMMKAREKTYEVDRDNTMPDRDSTDKS